MKKILILSLIIFTFSISKKTNEPGHLGDIVKEAIKNGGVPGIDVSAYQGVIDWGKVKNQG